MDIDQKIVKSLAEARESSAAQAIAIAHERLEYHAPAPDQLPRYAALREAAKAFVTVIIHNCPPYSTNQVTEQVELALMLANKSIALEVRR